MKIVFNSHVYDVEQMTQGVYSIRDGSEPPGTSVGGGIGYYKFKNGNVKCECQPNVFRPGFSYCLHKNIIEKWEKINV